MDDHILFHATDAIIGLDLRGSITYSNTSAEHLLGLSSRELLDRDHRTLLADDPNHTYEMIRESLMFGEHIDPIRREVLTKGGKAPQSVLVQYSPMKSDKGKFMGISAIMRKLTQSEKVANKAQALLETAPDAMVIVNQQGQIVLVNAQTEAQFGYTKEELLGKELEILVPDDIVYQHRHQRERYVSEPVPRNMSEDMELKGQRKDGSTFPVEVSLSPLKTENGLFISAAIRNISDRKKEEHKFRRLLDSAPDAIVIVGNEGLIQIVNAQVEKIFGYNKEDLIGKKVEELIPERYKNKHPGHRNSFAHNPKVRPMGAGLELSGLRKNGEEFPVEISLSPMETKDGILIIAAIRDITDRKSAQKELERKYKELEEKNKELEQFAYVASHDLQEPLQTVISLTEFLAESYGGMLDTNGAKSMEYVLASTKRMRQLIKGLLDYSQIGRQAVLAAVDCNTLLMEIKEDLSTVITNTKASIKVEKLPIVQGYETALRQLFQNLLTNAIKFTKANCQPVVSVFCKEEGENWLFGVKDNGIGIDKKYVDRIFIIFQRLHLREQYEGTGIGLAHCRKIVALHHGKIWVESEINKGSTFYFTIPK